MKFREYNIYNENFYFLKYYMYQRILQENIEKWFFSGKIITVYGPRQVGKTTLIQKILEKYSDTHFILSLNADEERVRNAFIPSSFEELKNTIGNPDILFIDEAQRIKNIGLVLKIIHDNLPDLQIIITGSSTLSLANTISEPLTGRNIEFQLFPLSLQEVSNNAFEASGNISQMMLWGSYPDVFQSNIDQKKILLQNLTNQYLYQDILEYGNIKKPHLLKKLLQLLAFQIGSEVSLSELSSTLEIDKKTVEKYLDLLEKSFVIFPITAFSRNLRREISRSKKYFFYDLGVRNMLIENFLDIDIRNDKGGLFENLYILERLKYKRYNNDFGSLYFWRTHTNKEIDLIEEKNGKIFATEIKFSNKKNPDCPNDFVNAYPNSSYKIVNPENFWNSLV